jgi:hypothetical protein
MRRLLADVRQGMTVYDRGGDRIGIVRDVYLGAEDDAATTSSPPMDPHSFIDDLARALAPTGPPEVVRQRMLREGFIRIDSTGPFAADRYAFASQIRAVSADAITLDAFRDELVRL